MDTFENNENIGQQETIQDELTSEPAEPRKAPENPEAMDAQEAAQFQAADVQETPETQQTPTTQEPSTAQEAPQSVAGSRKKSPYADSPYVTQRQPEYQYQPQRERPPKKEKREKKPGTSGTGRRAAAIVLTAALVAAGCGITAASVNAYWEKRMDATVNALNGQISALDGQIGALEGKLGKQESSAVVSRPSGSTALTPSEIYEKNVNSVVAVTASISVPGYYGVNEGYSSASGFIIREDGYVVTNCHVVEDASNVTITLNDGTEYEAKVVGADSANDIAVLKAEAEGLPTVTIGSSSDLKIGDMVVAIGNHLGTLSASQTVGYISGINREVTTTSSAVINMLQTDAVINSGSSGGPLFNTQGEVIGITTAKASGESGSGALVEGISFAIPVDDVKSMLSDLVDLGYITGAYLGVTIQDVDPYTADWYGLPMGAYVVTVTEGNCAQKAGVQPKDIITGLGDTAVESRSDLTRALRSFKAGDETTITVVRGGKELTLPITLDERPKDLNNPVYAEEPEMPEDGDYDEWYDYFRYYFGD